MKHIIVQTIRLYQRTLSPDHGPAAGYSFRGCRYYPSCSEYMVRSISKDGVIIGGLHGLWRILRCNPWTEGGVDDVT